MKTILLSILLLYIAIGYSQAKKEYLFDEKGNPISGQAFLDKIKDSQNYHYIVTETETTKTAVVFASEEKGILEPGQRDEVIKNLEKLTGRKIAENETIIINFFHEEQPKATGQKPCIDHYTTDKAYQRFIKKNPDYKQFFITSNGYDYGKDNVFEDTSGVIEALFIYGQECGNYIIIKPNGHFLRRYGEYRQDDIAGKVSASW